MYRRLEGDCRFGRRDRCVVRVLKANGYSLLPKVGFGQQMNNGRCVCYIHMSRDPVNGEWCVGILNYQMLRYGEISQIQSLRRTLVLLVQYLTKAISLFRRTHSSRDLHTFSRAVVKSALFTLIRRSRNAIKPASVQMALMSAPDKSSFAMTYSSSSTSSAKLMRDVCSLEK